MNYKINAAEFKKLCVSITTRGKKLDADIQHAGLCAITAVADHGNVGYVNMLYLALQAGARKSAMTEWLLQFGGVIANTEKGKAEMPFKFDREKSVNIEAAMAMPWYECKPDAEPDQVFDVVAALKSIIKKAAGKNVDALHLAKVENLCSELTNAAAADPLETTK